MPTHANNKTLKQEREDGEAQAAAYRHAKQAKRATEKQQEETLPRCLRATFSLGGRGL